MKLTKLFNLLLIVSMTTACQRLQDAATINQLEGQAMNDLADGKFAQAESIFRQILKLDPNNSNAYALLATTLVSQGKDGEAVTNYRQAIQHNPDELNLYMSLADALRRHKRIDEAVSVYDQVMELSPDTSYFESALVERIDVQNQVEQATAICRQDTIRYATSLYARLGQILDRNNRVDAAIFCYRLAIKKNPNDLFQYLILAELLKREKKLDEASTLYREVIQHPSTQKNSGSYLYIYRDLIQILIEQKKFDQAIAECRKVLQINPNDDYANRTLAYALQQQSNR